jgi:hypothetical protein
VLHTHAIEARVAQHAIEARVAQHAIEARVEQHAIEARVAHNQTLPLPHFNSGTFHTQGQGDDMCGPSQHVCNWWCGKVDTGSDHAQAPEERDERCNDYSPTASRVITLFFSARGVLAAFN